jgi:GNAT superfamily N-acetyltransferase
MKTSSGPPSAVSIRAITPADRTELARFYAGLSADTLNARFHGATHGIEDRVARFFCGPDHAHREGLVAELGVAPDERRIVGHLCLEPTGPGEVEMAIAVDDAWQGRGIGRALLDRSIGWARAHAVDRLRASMLWSNAAILGLLRTVDRPMTLRSSADGDLEAVIDVGNAVPTAA